MRGRYLITLVAVAGAIMIAIAGWWLFAGRGSDAPPGPPVAEVYAGVAGALTRPGMVAHVTFDTDEPGGGWISSRREGWLDVAGDVARTRTTWTYRSPSVDTTRESGVVYRAGMAFGVGEDGQRYAVAIQHCPAATADVLSLLADCPRAPGTITTRTEAGRRFDSHDAIAVVIEGKRGGIDSVVEVHDRLYVDAVSRLPLAFERAGTDRYAVGGYENDFRNITRYAIEFVARESLAEDFFEPAAVGYRDMATPEPAAAP